MGAELAGFASINILKKEDDRLRERSCCLSSDPDLMMKSELIVDVQSDDITIALTEDDRLMEWGLESKTEATFAVGNIYYGRVKKVMPALNAVFVDVGYEKEAFLHYLDLGSQFLTLEKFTQFAVQEKNRKPLMQKTPQQKEVGKQGSIQDVCRVGQEILVQVAKEPINTKGPRLTAEISLAGRNIVLIPFGDKVMVSSKIKSEAERSRLKQLVQAIKPERFGVIVRTVAEGKRVAELDAELRLLLKRWEETVARLQKAKPVSLVTAEIGRTIGVIRDVFTPDFSSIYVNDQAMYEEVQSYVGLIAPESEKIVKLYKGDQPIFDHFGITRQMKTGLGRTVGFKNGGYLIMERTEALFSIDVNSGSKKLGTDQEDNAFQCNMLAADEIYHQLRLRDIGGIIIVDFIDMDSAEHRQLLFEHMRKLMKRDRARHNVLQLSKFGLMQITRQRVRPVVEVDVQEVCPTCGGKGRVQPSLLFTDILDEQIELYQQHFGRGLKLYVHPFVYAYATSGFIFRTLRFKWLRAYGVHLHADESLPLLDYRFVGKDGKRVDMPRMTELTTDAKAERKAALYATKLIEEKPEVKLSEAVLAGEKADTGEHASNEKTPSDTSKDVTANANVNEEAAPAKKKRRSRKKKGSAADEPVATAVNEKTSIEQTPSETAAAESVLGEEAPAKPKKKHSRKKKGNAAVEAAANVQTSSEQTSSEQSSSEKISNEVSEEAEVLAKPKKKRSSRKKAATVETEANANANVEDNANGSTDVASAEVKPKKRTSRKKAATNEVAVDENVSGNDGNSTEVPSEKAAKPKKKRTPRKKTTAAEAVPEQESK